MILHEAIQKLLKEKGRAMSTNEITDALNKSKWYQKKDGSLITAFQIHGRTKNYPQLFIRNGSMISLVGNSKTNPTKTKPPIFKKQLTAEVKQKSLNQFDHSVYEKSLLNEKVFKGAGTIDNDVPHCCGLYCIRIINKSKLPSPFNKILEDREHNIIYIGIASTSLKSRFLNQELRANGHGTFFRSVGAMLGYKPLKGSLINKANKRNFKFSPNDEKKIIEWINKNLVVNWIEINENFETIETYLVKKYRPLLNIAKNPSAIIELKELRASCVKIANSI